MEDPVPIPSAPPPGPSPSLLERLYEGLDRWRKASGARSALATILIVVYLGALLVVEIGRSGWLPAPLANFVGVSRFAAIGIVFYLLVLGEIVGLIFGLADSVARAVGKQLEILSLILIRQSFEILAGLSEPIRWDLFFGRVSDNRLIDLLVDAAAALIVFILIGYYYRIQHKQPISQDARDQAGFVASKKAVALLLLIGLAVVVARGAIDYLKVGGKSSQFFEEVFSLLIFSDVLIVLISLRHSAAYRVVFRNSAFALATVLIRLALPAPPPFNALLGLAAALYAIGLTLAYNKFAPVLREVKPSGPAADH